MSAKSSVKAWIEAMRLRTLPVSIAGVIAGCGCAAFYGRFKLIPAAICFLFAVVAQIVSNFANEYYDFRYGLDRKGRDGFRRGVTEGDISPIAMKRAVYLLLLFDCLLGCSLILYGGWWLIIVGAAIAVFALFYSTGPYPLSHHGLGDIAVIIFFGFVPVCFTCYVQTGVWDWASASLPISFAIGMVGANVLIINNYRDADDDRSVGKHTSVVIFGRKVMRMVYLLFGIGAIALVCSALWGKLSSLWLLIPGVYLAVHVALWRALGRLKGSALNPLLGLTAMTLLIFSVALAIAMACR